LFTTRTLKVASTLAIVGLVALSLGDDDRAQKYLTRSITGAYNANIIAIQSQKTEDKGTVTVKVMRSKSGKISHSVTYPLHMQREYVDDGKTATTYLPDLKAIFVQPSNLTSQDNNFRLGLIQKNYTLKSDTGKKIKGRRCIIVTAVSKYSQVPTTRYHFDEATGFPMLVETVLSNGDVINSSEVIDIQFPPKLSDSLFEIHTPAGVDTINNREPQGISKLSEAARLLGFTPILPSKIPFGFQLQRITVASDKGVKMLALKLSDGIQRVTVYEWKYVPGEDVNTGEASVFQVYKGLRITVVSDFGSDLRESFLKPFLARADRENPVVLTSVGF